MTGTATATPIPYAYLPGGSFTLGDQTANAALSAKTPVTVTWWSSQWSSMNVLSGGAAPTAFKGFAANVSTTPPSCGGTWTTWITGPGNSSAPPSTVPPYMAVIVSDKITKSGDALNGTISEIVIVKTNAGYQASPGGTGTGNVVGVICHS
jgi:hypothetical protein